MKVTEVTVVHPQGNVFDEHAEVVRQVSVKP